MMRLRVPATLFSRHLVVTAVRDACELAREQRGEGALAERAVHELVSAVAEAFNNVVLHAYEDQPDAEVGVCIDIADGALTVELSDEGKSFDLDAVPLPQLDALPESGLGVFIMLSCVDEVDYRPGRPNRLILRKLFASG